MDDTARIMIERAGKAIARKLDADILSSIVAGVPSANTVNTGAVGTAPSYANLLDAIAELRTAYSTTTDGTQIPFGFKPTHMVINPTTWGKLKQDTDVKNMTYRAVVTEGKPLSYAANPEYFDNAKVFQTPQIAAGNVLFVDAENLGQLIKESDIEVYEGRLPGSPDIEVIALMSYGIGLLYPQASALVRQHA